MKVNICMPYMAKLARVKKYFPNLDFTYEQFRGSKTISFIHEAWILYNLIELHKPKEIYGLSYITRDSVEWRKGYFFPRRFYRWGFSGKQGPKKVIESVVPDIKLIQGDGKVIFIGYQNSFHGFRPDFSIYYGFKQIKLWTEENRVYVFFDDKLMVSILKDNEFWSIEKYNIVPNIIVEAKENKKAFSSKIRSNIKVYKEMFPSSKIVVVCPEQIKSEKLSGCCFVLDTFNEDLLERGLCDKDNFQKRLREVILQT